MRINAFDYSTYRELNFAVKNSADKEIIIDNVLGQRYIGCALSDKKIKVNGTPGNGLGAYLDGAEIEVFGNAQDATADTMNGGRIIIHGGCGDTVGYGMRGGKIFIRDSAGYRAGIHMKAYKEKFPVMVIGGSAGSFLAEYIAGGLVIVLGLNGDKQKVGYMCGTGMHGGKVIIRTENEPESLPKQVKAIKTDINGIKEEVKFIEEYCAVFNKDISLIKSSSFYVLTPDSKQPYSQMYTDI
jgi:glutamate synthase domain-containing protein 3